MNESFCILFDSKAKVRNTPNEEATLSIRRKGTYGVSIVPHSKATFDMCAERAAYFFSVDSRGAVHEVTIIDGGGIEARYLGRLMPGMGERTLQVGHQFYSF